LNDSQVVNLIMEYARGPEPQLAVEAIECLGRLKPAAAVNGLVSLLRKSKEKERLIACCRALGQIADPASIEPLARILARKGFIFHRKERAEIRAAAIFALGQISDPKVPKVLALYRGDPDPRIREIARTREGSGKLSSPKSPVKDKLIAAGPGVPPPPTLKA
jgi:HEAT repeat protein